MADDPISRLEIEFGFYHVIGATRALSALIGAARSLDCKPDQLAALVDLIAEKADTVQRLAGFGGQNPAD